jgi:small conductance mechanosensitive channel
VEFRIAYDENIDRVIGILHEIGASIQREPEWGALVIAPLEILGVVSLADGNATMRVRLKTLPLNQGKVANELRRRLMSTFVRRGVRPFAR